MAQFDTISARGGVRTAQIDEGLRTHMNKVYGTMSVGLLLTFAAAWAVGNNAAMMNTLFTGFTRYIVMFASWQASSTSGCSPLQSCSPYPRLVC